MSLSALPPKNRAGTVSQKRLVKKGILQDKCFSNIENHELYYLTTDRKLWCNQSKSVASGMIIQALEMQFFLFCFFFLSIRVFFHGH